MRASSLSREKEREMESWGGKALLFWPETKGSKFELIMKEIGRDDNTKSERGE